MKKAPMRMCIACRTMKEKRGLIRIVKNKDGEIFLDRTGKASGRGAYICNDIECIRKCKKTRALSRTFAQAVDDGVYDKIQEEFLEGNRT